MTDRTETPPAPRAATHPGAPAAAPTTAQPRGRRGARPVLRGRRLPRRLAQLYAGLVLYGTSMAFMVQSGLGLDPWDVLHQGVARRVGLSLGTVVIATGVLVLLAWWPLRQRPGLGTVSNVVVIGLAVDAALLVLPAPEAWPVKAGFLVFGILANGVATAAYIGARLGPGPRDGLMTGLVRVTGRSVRLVRTTIELSVLGAGWLLGGTVGVGTVAYALAIGPVVHVLLPRLTVPEPPSRPRGTPVASAP